MTFRWFFLNNSVLAEWIFIHRSHNEAFLKSLTVVIATTRGLALFIAKPVVQLVLLIVRPGVRYLKDCIRIASSLYLVIELLLTCLAHCLWVVCAAVESECCILQSLLPCACFFGILTRLYSMVYLRSLQRSMFFPHSVSLFQLVRRVLVSFFFLLRAMNWLTIVCLVCLNRSVPKPLCSVGQGMSNRVSSWWISNYVITGKKHTGLLFLNSIHGTSQQQKVLCARNMRSNIVSILCWFQHHVFQFCMLLNSID